MTTIFVVDEDDELWVGGGITLRNLIEWSGTKITDEQYCVLKQRLREENAEKASKQTQLFEDMIIRPGALDKDS